MRRRAGNWPITPLPEPRTSVRRSGSGALSHFHVPHFPLRTKCNSKYIKFSKSCTGVAFCGTYRHSVAFCGTYRHSVAFCGPRRHSVAFHKTYGREDAFSGLREGTRGDHEQSGTGATTNTRFSVVQYHSVRPDVLQYHYANQTHLQHRYTDMTHPIPSQSTYAVRLARPQSRSSAAAGRGVFPEVYFKRTTNEVQL